MNHSIHCYATGLASKDLERNYIFLMRRSFDEFLEEFVAGYYHMLSV